MSKALAVAAVRNPFSAAYDSAKNFFYLVGDFMYGTQERTNVTYSFALAMAILGVVLNAASSETIMTACAQDTLAR